MKSNTLIAATMTTKVAYFLDFLGLTTYPIPSHSILRHGLSYRPPKPILVAPKGLFQIFHDCYSEDLSIYLEEREFKLENIVDAGPINYILLYSQVGQHSLNINRIFDEKKWNQIR